MRHLFSILLLPFLLIAGPSLIHADTLDQGNSADTLSSLFRPELGLDSPQAILNHFRQRSIPDGVLVKESPPEGYRQRAEDALKMKAVL